MKQYDDREIRFLTRGDDIEMLSEAMKYAHGDKAVISYLAYLKVEILEQLKDIEFNREDYPIGSKKGYTWEQVSKIIEEED